MALRCEVYRESGCYILLCSSSSHPDDVMVLAEEANERERVLESDEAELYHFNEDEITDDVVEYVTSCQEMTFY